MTTLTFRDELTENPFTFGNRYVYTDGELIPFGILSTTLSNNYPFILKSGDSDSSEIHFTNYPNQLRGRLLNTKKIKEVMDTARIPLLFLIKGRSYMLGKGFLSTYDPTGENHKLLFIACVDGTKNITDISQVKFFVSKEIYTDSHKSLQPAIKDFVSAHPGDVTICNNILDYVGERLTFPKGGSLAAMKKYKEAVVRAATEAYLSRPVTVVEIGSGLLPW